MLGNSSHSCSRRAFLASAAVAAAAVCRAAEPIAPASEYVTLGMNTYGVIPFTTEQAIVELSKAGFDTVQLDCTARTDGDPGNLTPSRRADIRKIIADHGMAITAIQGMSAPSHDNKAHANSLDRLKVLGQLVHELNPARPPLIEIGLGGRDSWEKIKPMFVKRVSDWVKTAERDDLHLLVKPHRDTSMDRPEEAIELFKETGSSPRLRMSWDYSHFALRDMPLVDCVRTALPWTGFVAMKDVAIENGKGVFKLPGETHQIDYSTLIGEFYRGGYRGDFNCEISAMIFKKKGYDALAAVRTTYENIAPAFAASGAKRLPRK